MNKHSLKQTKHANTERAQQGKSASIAQKSANVTKELLETLVNVVRGEPKNLRDTVRRRDRNSFAVEESRIKHVSQTNSFAVKMLKQAYKT